MEKFIPKIEKNIFLLKIKFLLRKKKLVFEKKMHF